MRQLARAALVVRPASFGWNAETAATNTFQTNDPALGASANARALAEHDALVSALRAAGVEIVVEDDTPEPPKPDALFPNNWISTHEDGTIVLYPMAAPNRRAERRADIVERLVARFGFRTIVDLARHEADGAFLEGTGSLVLDRAARIAFVALSPRADLALAERWARLLGFERVVAFRATSGGAAVYHANVVMSVGARVAIACFEAMDEADRPRVRAALEAPGRALVEISRAQMERFAGNALELATRDGARVWAMSRSAWDALDEAQRATLSEGASIVRADVATIERLGGGSVRCMLAEIFTPA